MRPSRININFPIFAARLAEEKKMKLQLYSADLSSVLQIAYADQGVRAGFPSPAQDYMTDSIDLNKELVRHPATTFGDLLVIDKGIEPADGDIVVAFIDGEFTLKRVKVDQAGQCLWLVPANEQYEPIRVTEENNFIIWGVLTYNIKPQFRKR